MREVCARCGKEMEVAGCLVDVLVGFLFILLGSPWSEKKEGEESKRHTFPLDVQAKAMKPRRSPRSAGQCSPSACFLTRLFSCRDDAGGGWRSEDVLRLRWDPKFFSLP